MATILKPIQSNLGVEAEYRKKLKKLIDEMTNSCEYWISTGEEPLLAQDISPVSNIKKIIAKLRKQWESRFAEYAPKIAELYTRGVLTSSDHALLQALKASGLSVKFVLTQNMKDNLAAITAENVTLIKSIQSQYLNQVEGAVLRGYTTGRDLKSIVSDLKQIKGVTTRRAELIARDQTNKANATVLRTRQMDLGITEGIWMHSHGGKEPRASHVAANGKKFKLSEGMLIDGKYILPGEEINCRCTWRGVLPI